jgi:hypothetical protein
MKTVLDSCLYEQDRTASDRRFHFPRQ